MDPSRVIKIMNDNLINFAENNFTDYSKNLNALFDHICNMLKKAPIDHNDFTVVNSACDIYTNNNFRELKWCAYKEPLDLSRYIRICLSILTTDKNLATLSISIYSNNDSNDDCALVREIYKKTCDGYPNP